MMMASRRNLPALIFWSLTALALLPLTATPAQAQNRRKAWEVFIYFGQYRSQKVPSAIQQGTVSTYRMDPALTTDAGTLTDPNLNGGQPACTICTNLGDTGPGPEFVGPFINTGSQLRPEPVDICFNSNNELLPAAFDTTTLDECDNDVEARYIYNANGIVTNGEVQRNEAEFLLGARFGYNITRHWEVELDLGFAKQRLDMTRNLIPLLKEEVSNPADPFFAMSADFFEFTYANSDFLALGYEPALDPANPSIVISVGGMKEIPNVPHRRSSNNPGADIPAVLPMPVVDSERFEDVTDFVNRIFLDPTAFRNRANQINIDIFSVGISGAYNFNTSPDSRFVPYVTAGLGRWIRQFDTPYDGENSDYFTFGGGARFFVNEIFAFRVEGRQVMFREDEITITAKLPRQNLRDMSALVGRTVSVSTGNVSGCVRDNDPPEQNPPRECSINYINAFGQASSTLPSLPGGVATGGFATAEFITETDNFWEARVGFDVLLGGR